MSVAQWLELSHRIDRERGTLDWAKCKEISEDLDLDYSQVIVSTTILSSLSSNPYLVSINVLS